MLPTAHISHQTTGRLRIKIPARKGDNTYFNALKEHFSALEGVRDLQLNPTTGSVLILHTLDNQSVAQYATANNMFSLTGANPSSASLHLRVTETFKGMNNQVRAFTSGEINIGSLAFLGLMGAGIYQIGKGNFTAIPWYTAFWYALNIFLKSQDASKME
ncbi:MAG TPA: hypothetical protein VEI46_11355 [Thermodesulfovibrionales bacterium]|nr:hypothetical protein [Thermodesulfovibrionales bacterium]